MIVYLTYGQTTYSTILSQYQLRVDKNARHKNLPTQFVDCDFFGQLLRLVVLSLAPSSFRELGLQDPETLILAVIRTVKITQRHSLGVHFYEQDGPVEVVDLNAVQCVVGRVRDRGRWAIIDRSGALAQIQYVH